MVKLCRYWEEGRGCFNQDRCRYIHDPELRDKNRCHRFQRGVCKYGNGCPRLHEEVSHQAHPPGDGSTLLTDLLWRSMSADKKHLDETARRLKFKAFYLAKFHPDKWEQSMEIAAEMATPVTQWLNVMKEWYVGPDA